MDDAPVAGGAGASTRVRLHRPLDLGHTLGNLRQGRSDPMLRVDGRVVWRCSRTPAGPVTQVLVLSLDGTEVETTAWGPGADWAIAHTPDLIGEHDDLGDFARLADAHPVVAECLRRRPGLRVPRTRRVVEALVWTVCGQKVTGVEAKRSYRGIVRRWGEPAPDPGVAGAPRLRLQPAPDVLARVATHDLHGLGLERKRAATIVAVAATAHRLEEAVDLDREAARRRLRAVEGVGPWSSAEVALVACGDADAVSIGDYHLPNIVAFALAGEERADDHRMLELLEPFRPHRGRTMLLLGAHPKPPRRGPRMPIRGFEAQ